jgi:hypothetical protein
MPCNPILSVVSYRRACARAGREAGGRARLTRASAQVGDYADTLMLPNLGTEAVIRWLSGPADIVGTGVAVLHCHILPVRAAHSPRTRLEGPP